MRDELIPALTNAQIIKPMKSGRPIENEQKGHSYTIYITPAEKMLLDCLGKRSGGKGLSGGIRYLIKFFAENVNMNK